MPRKNTMNHRLSLLLGALLCLLLIVGPVWGQTRYQVQDLGTLSGGRAAAAAGLNAAGWVVGTSTGTTLRGFRWPAQGPLLDLGNLPGGVHTRAVAVNARNEIAGASGDTGFLVGTDGILRAITGGGSLGTIPTALSDNGTVVGAAFFGSRTRAFRWSRTGGLRDLGTLPGGDFSIANGIDAAGRVVGESATARGRRAFLWTATAGHRNLGTLGGDFSSAAAIWNGEVVGSATNAAGVRLPFRWTASLGMRALPLPPRAVAGDAVAVGPYGVVGRSYDATGASRAFLWTAAAGSRDLSALLDAGGEGWTLLTATGINSAGQIVGTADYQGATRAYLASPAPTLAAFRLGSEVVGGNEVGGSVELAAPALPGGAFVGLRSSGPAANPNRSVKVTAGTRRIEFRVATAGVASPIWVRITATAGASRREALVRVLPATLQSLSILPATVSGGNRATATITLNGNAPPAGSTVILRNSDPNLATVPATVRIEPNVRSATFEVTTRPVTSRKGVSITAILGNTSRMTTLTLVP